jgi:hypothetical protein
MAEHDSHSLQLEKMKYNSNETQNVKANKVGDDLNGEKPDETKNVYERPKEVEKQTKEHDPENTAVHSSIPTLPDESDADLVSWDSPSDPSNPHNWPSWWCWVMIILASFISFIAGLSSSMFAPALPAVEKEFHSSNQALGSLLSPFSCLVWHRDRLYSHLCQSCTVVSSFSTSEMLASFYLQLGLLFRPPKTW